MRRGDPANRKQKHRKHRGCRDGKKAKAVLEALPAIKLTREPHNTRARYKLDWELIDYLFACGCTGSEIAARLGISTETLQDRVKKEKGMTMGCWAANMRGLGYSLLRQKQMEVALEGDKTMLIFLGKVCLGQKEASDHLNTAVPPHIVKVLHMLETHHDRTISIPDQSQAESEPEGIEQQD